MADPYGPVEAVYKIMYSDNVKLAQAATPSKLEPCMSYISDLKGKQMQVVELVGPTEARIDAQHTAPTPIILPGHEGIYVQPRRADWGTTIPNETPIKAAVDYTSKYVQSGVSAIRRAVDRKIYTPAFFGPRLLKLDEDNPPVATAFDTASQAIPANYGGGGATGLTVKKFVAGIAKFAQFEEIDVESEEIFLGLTVKQTTDLYNEIQATSKDYVGQGVFDKKTIIGFMNVKFVLMYNLPVTTEGYRRCPMWCKSGMWYGDAMAMTTMIDRDPGMQYQVRPYMERWVGVTRSEDKYVVEIDCAESA